MMLHKHVGKKNFYAALWTAEKYFLWVYYHSFQAIAKDLKRVWPQSMELQPDIPSQYTLNSFLAPWHNNSQSSPLYKMQSHVVKLLSQRKTLTCEYPLKNTQSIPDQCWFQGHCCAPTWAQILFIHLDISAGNGSSPNPGTFPLEIWHSRSLGSVL